jgi:uncharacterized membrane protein
MSQQLIEYEKRSYKMIASAASNRGSYAMHGSITWLHTYNGDRAGLKMECFDSIGYPLDKKY